jgi:tRNA-Thr(GGU) m(6)t(6)A37 methyltransferase TsaA
MMQLKKIATIYTPFADKFGIPRQSGMASHLCRIVFEPEYRDETALRGIEEYSHLWLIWQFSEAIRDDWSPTVRPPRLGGNKRVGVFATRSPFRPNPIGLSSVRLISVEFTKEYGPVLTVGGADILDGTPIYDIKPYLAYTDSHPDAIGGFADGVMDYKIEVDLPPELAEKIDTGLTSELITLLENDPRPSYKVGDEKEYGMRYGRYEIFFRVVENVLHVTKITEV